MFPSERLYNGGERLHMQKTMLDVWTSSGLPVIISNLFTPHRFNTDSRGSLRLSSREFYQNSCKPVHKTTPNVWKSWFIHIPLASTSGVICPTNSSMWTKKKIWVAVEEQRRPSSGGATNCQDVNYLANEPRRRSVIHPQNHSVIALFKTG